MTQIIQREPTTTATGTRPAVAVYGLTKHFGGSVAVDRLSFEIPTGVVAGFIGPNGAGKTTTMGMLLGLVRPTGGSAEVLGHPIANPTAYMSRVGALIEGPALWPGLSGARNLHALAALGGHDRAQVPELLDLVGLGSRGDDRFGDYSFGMKQRLGIAAALVGDPNLLVLDEPTNGLDPAGINEMRRLIARVGHGERTVLVSSHILSELEQICDWLIVIDHGALLYQGPTQGFMDQAAPVVIATPEDVDDLDRLVELAGAGGFDAARDGDHLALAVDGHDPRLVAADLNRAAIAQDIVLRELRVKRPDLESHYLSRIEGANPS
ncbi:ABC transporter ATP-binding protein [soil metagenome]